MKYNISLIKYLWLRGYRVRQIQIITGYPESYISKYKDREDNIYPTDEDATEEQMRRKMVLDILLSQKHITWDTFDRSDEAYVNLLSFCLVPAIDIAKMYSNISRYYVIKALRDKRVSFLEADPERIGVSKEDFMNFAEMCESINLKKTKICDII